MQRFTLSNPGFVTTYEEIEADVYTLNALGPRRILTTTEFMQQGPEREELGAMYSTSWDVEVPEEAELFGATSGISSGNTHQFWVGWRVGRRFHMQALMQEKPIEAELAADEAPIFPAVMDRAGLASLYSWQPARAGMVLLRRVFSGKIKQPAGMMGEALSEIPGRPMLSVATAIPGERSQHAVIGWVEETERGAVLALATILPDRMRVARSEPIVGCVPFARQRLGIWAEAPADKQHARLTALVTSRSEQGGVKVATFDVGPPSSKPLVTLVDANIPATKVEAAAFDYMPDFVAPHVHQALLSKDGTLLTGKDLTIKRHGVPLDSPLPIVTTSYVYWGTRAPDGTMTFENL